jgi:predicted nucleotidyltransferase
MNPRDPNVALVEAVAKALGKINERVVFAGGCAVGLLITDDARPVVRATQDVDVIAEIASLAEYHELSKELRHAGFVEDRGEVICRWRLGALMVDVMPTNEPVMGCTNRWHPQAVRDARPVTLPNGITVRLITGPLLLATKLEAFYDRGNGDFAASHDLEDIVNLIDGRVEIVKEVADADGAIRDYLRSEFDDLISDTAFAPMLPYHLGGTDAEQARVEIIFGRMREIVGL